MGLFHLPNAKLINKKPFISKNMHLKFGKNWKNYKFLQDARKLDIQNWKTLKLGYCTMNKEALQKISFLYLEYWLKYCRKLHGWKKIEIWNAPFVSFYIRSSNRILSKCFITILTREKVCCHIICTPQIAI